MNPGCLSEQLGFFFINMHSDMHSAGLVRTQLFSGSCGAILSAAKSYPLRTADYNSVFRGEKMRG